MSSRCENCGGTLIYDIKLAKVRCENCDSTFEPESYKINSAADETKESSTYDATEFTCPNCGAQISSTEFDAVDYCMYCASFVSLDSQMKKLRMPDKIMPFSKTKDDCKEAYRKAMKKKIYAPAEFRDESFIDGFNGIYVPFWNYEYSYGPEIILRGETKDREGDYIHTQEYISKCKVSGEICNNSYDASSNFDDEISCRVAPFPLDKMKEFNSSYMFGFYGDTADVDKDLYAKASDEAVEQKLFEDLTHQKSAGDGHFVNEKPKTFAEDVRLQKNASLVMLPIWFLTWRKNDRIAYSVVNGETGQVYTEAPVDIFKFILFSLITAVPIFFLLNASITFSAKNMLISAMFLAVMMGMLYVTELDKHVRRIMHSDDRGYLETHEEAKAKSDELVSDNIVTELVKVIVDFIVEMKFVAVLVFAAIIFFFTDMLIYAVLFAIVLVPIYSIFRLRKDIKILNDKSVWVDISGIAFSFVYSAILLMWDPAPDDYFYIASMLSMLGIAFAAIRMVKRYNKLITRPLPHFFEKRNGGNAS